MRTGDGVVRKRMPEARAGGFLKMAAGYERGRTGVGDGDGTGSGTDDFGSEQEEKIERMCGGGMG